MSQTSIAQSELEPPYTLKVGGKVQYRSVPTYARAISLAESYVKHGARLRVEVFDRHHTRVYVSETGVRPA